MNSSQFSWSPTEDSPTLHWGRRTEVAQKGLVPPPHAPRPKQPRAAATCNSNPPIDPDYAVLHALLRKEHHLHSANGICILFDHLLPQPSIASGRWMRAPDADDTSLKKPPPLTDRFADPTFLRQLRPRDVFSLAPFG